MKELRSGKSPAVIAKANGKSVGGLESALIAPVKARLDAAVKAGRLTKSQERHVLGMVTRGTDDFVTTASASRCGCTMTGTAAAPPSRPPSASDYAGAGTSTVASPSTTSVSPTHARVESVARRRAPSQAVTATSQRTSSPGRTGAVNRSRWPR
jgi:hypothetical protein